MSRFWTVSDNRTVWGWSINRTFENRMCSVFGHSLCLNVEKQAKNLTFTNEWYTSVIYEWYTSNFKTLLFFSFENECSNGVNVLEVPKICSAVVARRMTSRAIWRNVRAFTLDSQEVVMAIWSWVPMAFNAQLPTIQRQDSSLDQIG